MIINYLLYVFITIVVVQFIYYILLFGQFTFSKSKKIETHNKPVSVIICSKNEEENLKNKLAKFSNQNYPKYELVLVNDRSTDDTQDVLEQFKEENEELFAYRNITVKIVNVQENEQFWGSKKYALTLGIKAASHELLLFSDADCEPVSEYWIQEMTAPINDDKSIVLGYGGYKFIKNSLLNKLIRFETLITAIQYFSYAKMGTPYMGVGRNLAYKKSQFFAANGFANHMHLRSGDDDLFVNQIASKKNTACCYSLDSITLSEPKTSFTDWSLQKRRHISTASYYKIQHKLMLGLFYYSQILFWIIGTVLLFLISYTNPNKLVLILTVGLMVFRFSLTYLTFGLAAKKLNEQKLVLFSPFLELLLIFSQLLFYLQNLISKPKHW